MNREIKFRGLRKDGKGWIISNGLLKSNKGIVVMIESEDDNGLVTCPVLPESVGQFSGALDRKCEEVYEGDKIRAVSRFSCKEIEGEIIFNSQMFCVKSVQGNCVFSVPLFYATSIELIGNIHETDI